MIAMKLDTSEYIDTAEFARRVGKSADYIKTYCRRGVIEAKNPFGRWLIPISEVEKFKKANRKPGPKSKK